MQQASYFPLPSSPDLICDDRFDILDRDGMGDPVPFWTILSKLLKKDIASAIDIVDILETIALTLGRTTLCDYDELKNGLNSRWFSFSKTWLCLRELALELPHLFPTHTVPILLPGGPGLDMTRRQVACLVIHQFLCTLPAPSTRADFFDFSIWYSSNQPHSTASTIYIASLLTYFDRLASKDSFSPLHSVGWKVKFHLHDGTHIYNYDKKFLSLDVRHDSRDLTHPCNYGLPDGAGMVFANKVVGFGQSGTQEERYVAASPESCPMVLITPPLRDPDVLVITGAEAMITIVGHGRHIDLGEELDLGSDPVAHQSMWQSRTMLFADALELDGYTVPMPDLLPGHVRREFCKAVTAYASGQQKYSKIVTGLWGCGAFGGNPAVKAIIQWCAASTVATQLVFICNNRDQPVFGGMLLSFMSDVMDLGLSVEALMKSLHDLSSEDFVDCEADEMNKAVFDTLKLRLQNFSVDISSAHHSHLPIQETR